MTEDDKKLVAQAADAVRTADMVALDPDFAAMAQAVLRAIVRKMMARIESLSALLGIAEASNQGAANEIVFLQTRVRALEDALVSIEEYWNGGFESAVNAAEIMRERARAALEENRRG